MMSDLFPACRLLALATIGLGLSATVWADPPADKSKPHGLRAPLDSPVDSVAGCGESPGTAAGAPLRCQ